MSCLFFTDCRRDRAKIEQLRLNLSQDIEEYPDSSYFSDIRCIEFYDNYLYFLDPGRKDVAKIDLEFATVEYIGRGGRGPGELLFPATVSIFEDTISILDASLGILRYKDKAFLELLKVDNLTDYRFFSSKEGYFLPTSSVDGTFQIVSLNESEEISYHGNPEKYESAVRTRVLNGRNLHSHPSGIVTVPDGLPFVEIYDWKTKECINRIDLSNIEPYEINLKEIKKHNYDERTYPVLVRDSYMFNNDLFILCLDHTHQGEANLIIKLNFEKEPFVESIITLPDRNYMSICVNQNSLIAFNRIKTIIEKYERIGF